MTASSELARVVAKDPRFTIEAYEFIFATLEHARRLRQQREKPSGRRRRSRGASASRHVTGQELCHAARDLAVEHYGMLAPMVLEQWGLRSTSDLGDVVYNLIDSGDLEKTAEDARADFDDVFDFDQAMRREYVIDPDDFD